MLSTKVWFDKIFALKFFVASVKQTTRHESSIYSYLWKNLRVETFKIQKRRTPVRNTWVFTTCTLTILMWRFIKICDGNGSLSTALSYHLFVPAPASTLKEKKFFFLWSFFTHENIAAKFYSFNTWKAISFSVKFITPYPW